MYTPYREQLIKDTPVIEPDMRIAISVMDKPYVPVEVDPFGALLWWSEARARVHMIRVDAMIAAAQLPAGAIEAVGALSQQRLAKPVQHEEVPAKAP